MDTMENKTSFFYNIRIWKSNLDLLDLIGYNHQTKSLILSIIYITVGFKVKSSSKLQKRARKFYVKHYLKFRLNPNTFL